MILLREYKNKNKKTKKDMWKVEFLPFWFYSYASSWKGT